jgi:hypothetical protein
MASQIGIDQDKSFGALLTSRLPRLIYVLYPVARVQILLSISIAYMVAGEGCQRYLPLFAARIPRIR